jgi:peptidoglycan hydrolase-like protein with peptidoglycan-binding domain
MALTFIDGRTSLPKHDTKTFKTRSVSGIKGIVLHHTAGGDSPEATARYHVGPNHVSETGNPGLCYSFFIRQSGEVWWAWDLDKRTWSQGGRGSPVPGTNGNTNFLGICCGGDFNSAHHIGKSGEPPAAQMHAVLCLCLHLTGYENHPAIPDELFNALPCSPEAMWSHAQFGKAACPGATLEAIATAARHHLQADQGARGDVTDLEWQASLVALGYDLGAWGPNKDGVDGDWGAASKRALVQFQRDQDLTADGIRGPLTESALISELASKGLPDPR